MSCRPLDLAWLVLVMASTAVAGGSDHALFSDILSDHVRNGLVDYRALGADRRLDAYLGMLGGTDPASITDDRERLAFWINAYNAFTFRLIILHMPVESIRDISLDGKGAWDIPFIEIAGRRYTLNQIEHEIIRREFREPRIHMALVCAALGCPPLRSEAYRGADLERQLEDNTRRFMVDATKNHYDSSTGTLALSEIFSWFGDDFGETYGSVERFARQFYPVGEGRELTLRFLPYDWSLNARSAEGGGSSR